jgi:hypothetical protein
MSAGRGIYVASRTYHADMWKEWRTKGFNIISSWIDEASEGETDSFHELWERIATEVSQARALVFYARWQDFPLKGAFVEVGMAFMNKPIIVCLPGVDLEGRTMRPVGSWMLHESVTRVDNVKEALYAAANNSLIPVKP